MRDGGIRGNDTQLNGDIISETAFFVKTMSHVTVKNGINAVNYIDTL